MTGYSSEPRRGDCLSPTDLRQLGNPLDFIAEDHLRIRTMCAEIDRLRLADRVDPVEAQRVCDFLKEELPLLVADEDDDLLPLLIRRSTPDDDMRRLKARLDGEHAFVMARLPTVLSVFEALAEDGGCVAADMRPGLQEFAAQLRSHLILENAIVLPFARLRLTGDDCESLARRMLQRRGLDRLLETRDAE